MHRRRFIALAAVLASLSLVAAACGNNDNEPAPGASGEEFSTIKQGTLTVGSCLDYKPFEFRQSGKLTGFDVQLVEEIARRLNLKVEWVKANFNTIFTALDANKFDAVAAASTITPEREQIVDFSDPYYDSNQSLSANTKETPDLKTVNDLKSGDVVGVQKGTTGKDWAVENLEPKGIQIKTYTGITDAFTDLEAGQIQAIVNDEPSSRQEVADRANLAVVQPIVTKEQYGIALQDDNPELEAAINGALKEIIADGTYQRLFKKWFPTLVLPPEFAPKG